MEVTEVGVRVIPPKMTTVPVTKFVPVITIVVSGLPAVAWSVVIDVIVGPVPFPLPTFILAMRISCVASITRTPIGESIFVISESTSFEGLSTIQ